MSVRIAPWAQEFVGTGLAGSLFAVDSADRIDAARRLDSAGFAVHADVIIGADGALVGVTPDEVRAVRERVPNARLDLHLIVHPAASGAISSALDSVIALGLSTAAERLTVSTDVLRSHPAVVQDARRAGLPVWCELLMGDTAADLDDTDGRLVMLITPGSTDAADPAAMSLARTFRGITAVGVDGGVTHELAREAADLGAVPIVSGRALLATT